MIALDTNVVVRVLVADDEQQVERVRQRLRALRDAGEIVFVSRVVVAETAWVLKSIYRFDKEQILAALTELIGVAEIDGTDRGVLEATLTAWKGGRGDFADYLIREDARAHGASALLTFDEALLSEPGFVRP